MGLIFVTAGERSVACGSAKALNLPEWAKLSLSTVAKAAGNATFAVRL
jgi:hypothetical protein